MEQKKRKPFNLEAAKAGAPVVTYEGYPVKIYDFEFNSENYSIAGKIMFPDGDRSALWTKEGCYTSWKEYGLSTDLFMAPVRKEGWIKIHKQYSEYPIYRVESKEPISKCMLERYYAGDIYTTKEEAIAALDIDINPYIDIIKIEWEE